MRMYLYTEREGFEPSVTCATPVFKTSAINHSATFPFKTMKRKPTIGVEPITFGLQNRYSTD